jgi:hypothetical protein
MDRQSGRKLQPLAGQYLAIKLSQRTCARAFSAPSDAGARPHGSVFENAASSIEWTSTPIYSMKCYLY